MMTSTLYPELVIILRAAGCVFIRQGKGSTALSFLRAVLIVIHKYFKARHPGRDCRDPRLQGCRR